MSIGAADRVRVAGLRESGALREIFDTIKFQLYNEWCAEPDEVRRGQIWAKQSTLRDIQREFNKAADGVSDDG